MVNRGWVMLIAGRMVALHPGIACGFVRREVAERDTPLGSVIAETRCELTEAGLIALGRMR